MRHSILFVDDDALVLKALQARFEQSDYDTFFANTIEASIKILDKKNIHSLVTDYYLESTTCARLLDHIKTNHPKIKIYITSADQNILCHAHDIAGTIAKPVTKAKIDALFHK